MTLLDTAPPLEVTPAPLAPRLAAKLSVTVAVCIPARNEEATIDAVLDPVAALTAVGVIDEVIVIDDASTDRTASIARDHGVAVVPSETGPGKGQALATAVAATDAEILVFLDADVTNFTKGYGIEIGLLIDIAARFGRAAIAEVDLGERTHRNRPLHQLRPHADDIVGAVLDRVQLA